MPSFQVSPSGSGPIEVEADNWLVALGLVLKQLDRISDLGRLACEVLPNGTAIAKDLKGGARYVVQAEVPEVAEYDDPLRTLDPDVDLVEIGAFDSWLDDIAESGSTIFACQAALAAAQMVVPCDSASVLLLEDQGLRFVAASGPIATQLVGRYIPADAGAAGFAVQHRQVMVLREVGDDSRHYEQIDKETGYQTNNLACVPVMADETIFGVIEVLNFPEGLQYASGVDELERVAKRLAKRLAHGGPLTHRYGGASLSLASPAPEDALEDFIDGVTDEVSIEPISSSDIALALPAEDIDLYQSGD